MPWCANHHSGSGCGGPPEGNPGNLGPARRRANFLIRFANRSRCWWAVLDPSECDRRRGECITSIDTGRFRPVAMSRNSSRSSDNPRSRQETLPSDCTSVEKVSCPTSMARCGMSCATKGIQRRSVASANRLISLAPSFREVGCPGIRRARPDSKHDLRFRRIKRLVS